MTTSPAPQSSSSSVTSSAADASQLDPRFVVNQTIELRQDGKAKGYGFSYIDADSGRQVAEWVFQPGYVPPPTDNAAMVEPTAANRKFTSLGEWAAALAETGPNAVWQPGSVFARSYVSTFRGVPSPDVSFYEPYEVWPVVPTTPVDSGGPEQVDPGQVYAPAGPDGGDSGVSAKAALLVVTAAGAGHPELGDTLAHTAEFWGLFGDYATPSASPLSLIKGAPAGVPAQDLSEFLAYWNSEDAPEAMTALTIAACSRTDVNPYQ